MVIRVIRWHEHTGIVVILDIYGSQTDTVYCIFRHIQISAFSRTNKFIVVCRPNLTLLNIYLHTVFSSVANPHQTHPFVQLKKIKSDHNSKHLSISYIRKQYTYLYLILENSTRIYILLQKTVHVSIFYFRKQYRYLYLVWENNTRICILFQKTAHVSISCFGKQYTYLYLISENSTRI